MALLVLLNNFMHDFSAAGWIFCSILLFIILRMIPAGFNAGKSDDLYIIIIKILSNVRFFMILSFVGIVVFGIIRALAYRKYEWSAAAGDAQVTLLIVKHIILTIVFAAGIYYYNKAGKLIKNNK